MRGAKTEKRNNRTESIAKPKEYLLMVDRVNRDKIYIYHLPTNMVYGATLINGKWEIELWVRRQSMGKKILNANLNFDEIFDYKVDNKTAYRTLERLWLEA